MKRGVVVVGSLNMDFVLRVGRLPQPGETVRASDFQMTPGGKGANQAAAVGRLGGQAVMLGRVGEDVFAQQLRDELEACGCDVTYVLPTPGMSSGMAFLFVEESGANQIGIMAGANGRLLPEDVEVAEPAFREAGLLLIQLETPLATVGAALEMARRHGLTTVLDPTPTRPLPPEIFSLVDIFTPNETEIETYATSGEAATRALQLLELGPRRVILKMGKAGALVAERGGTTLCPAPEVNAVDTVAAGDCFNGALAVALAEGRSLGESVRFANLAAALSVTRPGALASIPTREEVNRFGQEARPAAG